MKTYVISKVDSLRIFFHQKFGQWHMTSEHGLVQKAEPGGVLADREPCSLFALVQQGRYLVYFAILRRNVHIFLAGLGEGNTSI
jgi:hypothetical protein